MKFVKAFHKVDFDGTQLRLFDDGIWTSADAEDSGDCEHEPAIDHGTDTEL